MKKLFLFNFLMLLLCSSNLSAQTIEWSDPSDLIVPENGSKSFNIGYTITWPSSMAGATGKVRFEYENLSGTRSDAGYTSFEITAGGASTNTATITIPSDKAGQNLVAYWKETRYEGVGLPTDYRYYTSSGLTIRKEGTTPTTPTTPTPEEDIPVVQVPGCNVSSQQTICGDQCIAYPGGIVYWIAGSEDVSWISEGNNHDISFQWYKSIDLINWTPDGGGKWRKPQANAPGVTYYKRETILNYTKNTPFTTSQPEQRRISNIVTVVVGTPPNITSTGDLTGCATQALISLNSPFVNNNQWYISFPQQAEFQLENKTAGLDNGRVSGTKTSGLLLYYPSHNQNGNYFVKNSTYGCNYTSNLIALKLQSTPRKPEIKRFVTNAGTVYLYMNYQSTGRFGWGQYHQPSDAFYPTSSTGTALTVNKEGLYQASVTDIYTGCKQYSNQVKLYWNLSIEYSVDKGDPLYKDKNLSSFREGSETIFNDGNLQSSSVGPNPAGSTLNINLPVDISAQVQIISTTGIMVKEVTTNGYSAQVDISDLQSGMYLVNIIQNGLSTKHKIQVVK